MEFPAVTPRAFRRSTIEAYAPNLEGVYGLLRHGSFVYIGKGRIKERLLAHNAGDNPCITRQAPTHFVYSMPPISEIDQVERKLIDHYHPPCNMDVCETTQDPKPSY
jgi:hypothetical protein